MITKSNFCGTGIHDYDTIYGREGLRIVICIQEENLVGADNPQFNVITEFFGKGQVSPRFIIEDDKPSKTYEEAHKRFMAQKMALSIYKDSKIL
jgi:hypothetical protein